MCQNKEENGCKKTFSKVAVRYSSGSLMYSGNTTDISKKCVRFHCTLISDDFLVLIEFFLPEILQFAVDC